MKISALTKMLGIGVAASALMISAQAQAITNPATITGVVKNQAGQPVTGDESAQLHWPFRLA